MNKFKLSAIASTVLLSAVIFTGCGSSSAGSTSTSGSTSSSVNAADGYVVKLNSAATALCGENTYSTTTVGAKGKLTFTGVTLDSSCVISVPSDAIIDSNNNGVYDAGTDKEAGFTLKARGDAKVVSHLTTLVQAKRAAGSPDAEALAALVNNYDPVEAATTIATTTDAAKKLEQQKLMMLGEVAKTVLESATESDAATITTTTFTDTTTSVDSLNVSSALGTTLPAAVRTAATNKSNVIKDVVKILSDIDTTKIDVNTLVVSMSDGDKNLTDSLTDSAKSGTTVNTGDLSNLVKTGATTDLTTTATTVNTSVSTANTSVSSLAPKLNLGTILKAGTKEITLNGDSFSTTISSANANLNDFFSVVLPSASLSKDVATLNTQTVSLSIELIDKDNTADTAKLTVSGIQLSLATANSNDVKITIPSGITVSATQTGLTSLSTIGNGATVTATTGSALENTDFSFNINTLVNTIGGTEIGTAITELNTYFKQANVYTVKVTLTGIDSSEVVIDNDIITGTVTVTN